jgi:hypothetical protein
MKIPGTGKSSTAGWVLAGVVAVPLFYLLTYPIVVHASRSLEPGAHWRSHYMKPYNWVVNHTPLKAPLHAYSEWWREVLEEK